MAEETKVPSGLSAFEKTNPLMGASAINPYGLERPELQEYADAQEKIIESLQQRYSQPNWFKIAAGFAKPQLGGFMASLGSASEAMGENVEQQRAAELPLAQMRAQLAGTKLTMSQRQQAAELAGLATQKPNGITAEDVAKVANLDKERGAILQQQLQNQQATRKEIMELHAAGRTDAELAAQYGTAFTQLFPSGTAALPVTPKGQTKTNELPPAKPEEKTKPSWFTGSQEKWDQTPLAARAELSKSAEESGQATAKDQLVDYRTRAEKAQRIVPDLTAMYNLAAKPNVGKRLGIFEKGDPLGAVGTALETNSFPAFLQNIRDQLTKAGASEEDINDMRTLLQLIAKNQLNVRQGQGNPTNFATEIEVMAGPSFVDPQDSFLRKTALALHENSHEIKNYSVYTDALDNGISPNKYIGSDPYAAFNKAHSDEHTRIATTRLGASASLPESLKPEAVNPPSPKPKPAGGKSVAEQVRERAEQIRKQKASQTP
jgi:hypothetical protein